MAKRKSMKKQKKIIKPSERRRQLAIEQYKMSWGREPLSGEMIDVDYIVRAIMNYLDETYDQKPKENN